MTTFLDNNDVIGAHPVVTHQAGEEAVHHKKLSTGNNIIHSDCWPQCVVNKQM